MAKYRFPNLILHDDLNDDLKRILILCVTSKVVLFNAVMSFADVGQIAAQIGSPKSVHVVVNPPMPSETLASY